MLISLIGAALLLAVGGALTWDRNRMGVAAVEGALRRLHPRQVRIQRDWFDGEQDTLTYDVEYAEADGRVRRNRCKVSVAEDYALYWERPLERSAT